MTRVLIVAAALFGALSANAQELIEGTPVVLDGDTLLFKDVGPRGGDRTVRLWGIDAPEMSDWPLGAWSRAALDDLLQRYKRVVCEVVDADRYGRDVANCFVGPDVVDNLIRPPIAGEDRRVNVGREMIRQGWAVGYRTFLATVPSRAAEFLVDETDARIWKRGIWKERP